MAETPVEAERVHDEPSPRRIVLDAPSWLPTEKFPRNLIIGALVAFVSVVLAATIIPFALGWIDKGDFEAFGYAGIFLANFFGTATVFIPVPGLTAAGQALIVAGPRDLGLNPIGVIIAGASGMALAESTAYAAGVVGRGMMEERSMPVGGRIGRWMSRMAARVD